MKPAPFKYIAATSLEHALALKTEYGDDAKFLAGGQSLIPAMNFRLARPAILVDINEIEELAGIRSSGAATRVGPLTRYLALQRDATFAQLFPLIGEALPHIAHPQIRNRGTIGGNLSHADPASELPAIAVALRARFRVQAARQERWVEASDFFKGALTTDLQPDEMLAEIELPLPKPRTGSCFMEIARRRGDFAIAGVAAMVTLGDRRECTDVRLAFCGVGETPVDASSAADARTPANRSSYPRCRGVRAGNDRSRWQRSGHGGLSAPYRGRSHRTRAADSLPAGARWTLTITTSRYR